MALAEALFDEITRQAAQVCESPAAALSLIEDGHHWFKSRGGVSPAETPRAIALCAETIRRKEALHLADVRTDERFAGGPEIPGASASSLACRSSRRAPGRSGRSR